MPVTLCWDNLDTAEKLSGFIMGITGSVRCIHRLGEQMFIQDGRWVPIQEDIFWWVDNVLSSRIVLTHYSSGTR